MSAANLSAGAPASAIKNSSAHKDNARTRGTSHIVSFATFKKRGK